MYRTIVDYNDYTDILNLINNQISSQNIQSILGDNLNISSASIGYLNILKDEINSFTNIINLNSENINLNANYIKFTGNLEYNTNVINENFFIINSKNLKINDVLVEFAFNPIDKVNNRGFVFPWYDNDIVNYGFLGFDTTSKTFKLINNINYNSNTNVSILPNYNLYGTLEILNLNVSKISSYNNNTLINNDLTVNNSILVKENLVVNNDLTIDNNLILKNNLNLDNNIFIQNSPNPLLDNDVANKYYVDNKLEIYRITHNKINTGDTFWKLFENVSDVNNMIIGYDTINNTTYIKKGIPNGTQITLTDQDVIFETKNEIIAMIDANGYYNTLSDINNKHSIKQKNIHKKYVDRIKKLKIYSYCYKNTEDDHINNQIYVGLIKQDIEKLFNGNCLGIKKLNSNHICNNICKKKINKHINYNEIVCYTILAFQEHLKDFDKLLLYINKIEIYIIFLIMLNILLVIHNIYYYMLV